METCAAALLRRARLSGARRCVQEVVMVCWPAVPGRSAGHGFCPKGTAAPDITQPDVTRLLPSKNSCVAELHVTCRRLRNGRHAHWAALPVQVSPAREGANEITGKPPGLFPWYFLVTRNSSVRRGGKELPGWPARRGSP